MGCWVLGCDGSQIVCSENEKILLLSFFCWANFTVSMSSESESNNLQVFKNVVVNGLSGHLNENYEFNTDLTGDSWLLHKMSLPCYVSYGKSKDAVSS
jgi:hypothetical protein